MKIHIVQKGDTLWEIANTYDVSFEELIQLNSHLSSPDMIMPGMKIKIPSSTKHVKQEKDTTKKETSMFKDHSAQPMPMMSDELKGSKETKYHQMKEKKEQPEIMKMPEIPDLPAMPLQTSPMGYETKMYNKPHKTKDKETMPPPVQHQPMYHSQMPVMPVCCHGFHPHYPPMPVNHYSAHQPFMSMMPAMPKDKHSQLPPQGHAWGMMQPMPMYSGLSHTNMYPQQQTFYPKSQMNWDNQFVNPSYYSKQSPYESSMYQTFKRPDEENTDE